MPAVTPLRPLVARGARGMHSRSELSGNPGEGTKDMQGHALLGFLSRDRSWRQWHAFAWDVSSVFSSLPLPAPGTSPPGFLRSQE